jgi:hypothetical protein
MNEPKRWKAGHDDEVWNAMSCARDAMQARECLSFLSLALSDYPGDIDRAEAQLRAMTGAQIIDGLCAYYETAYRSVANAIERR